MSTSKKLKLVAVVGPTASGKSDLAVEIALYIKKHAKQFGVKGAEIISADSRQIYRGMDIGTGKITREEMRGVPHHLLDVASPRYRFTVAHYQRLARRTINDIVRRKKIPIICGGTGFYIQAALENTTLPEVVPNPSLRKQLSKKTSGQLYDMLKKLDPARASAIDRHNPVRLIRAIEIAKVLGKVPPLKKTGTPYDVLYVGIKTPAKKLKEKIHNRLLSRIRAGMISEAKKIHRQGASWNRMEGLGLEYRYLSRFLTGKISKDTMLKELGQEIIHYSKRQITWFKRNPEIHWVETKQKALNLVESFLS